MAFAIAGLGGGAHHRLQSRVTGREEDCLVASTGIEDADGVVDPLL